MYDTYRVNQNKLYLIGFEFFSFFSRSGQQRISRDIGPSEENMVESAAIRIQAAYRGHTVRQSLNWRLPSGNTLQASHRRGLQEEVRASDTPTVPDLCFSCGQTNFLFIRSFIHKVQDGKTYP